MQIARTRPPRREPRSRTLGRACAFALLLVAFALVSIASPGVALQTDGSPQCRAPEATLDPGFLRVNEGESDQVRVHVVNAAGFPGTVAIRLTAPSGWSAIADEGYKSVQAAGDAARVTFSVQITAPTRATGLADGSLDIVLTLTCALPGGTAESRVATALPVAIESGNAPWILVVAAGAVVATGAGVYAFVSRLRGAWSVNAESVPATLPGESVEVPLVFHNLGSVPVTLELVVASSPSGWTAHLATTRLVLDPGDDMRIWCAMRVAERATPGRAYRAVVRAKRVGGKETRLARLSVRVSAGHSAKRQP